MIFRNMENKHTVYFNMCHHYRKILNAKPCVDTSPPKILQMNNQWRFRRPTSAFHQKISNQENVKQLQSQNSIRRSGRQYYYQHSDKGDFKNLDKSFAVPQKQFTSTILKSNVQSKLHTLHVYHPPRKKKVMLKINEGNQPNEKALHNSTSRKEKEKSPRLSALSVKENNYSEESSEDSAYNEGECILSSDSRGSTPQNSSNKFQLSKKSATNDTKTLKSIPSTLDTRNYKGADDIVYIQFLKDITNDILKKNIFTNKALRTVFQHHVEINKYNLEMERMLNEIAKLQERLGVPKDDKFDDEDYGLGCNTEHTQIADTTYEDEGIISHSASPASAIIEDGMNKNVEHQAKNEEEAEEAEQYDLENEYSDSFSDDNSYVSQADRIKSECRNNAGNNDEDSGSGINEEVFDLNEGSENDTDTGSSIQQIVSNYESDSDLEISEVN